MNTLKRFGTSRTALLVMLLIALVPSIVLLLPVQAHAVPCCGFWFITNYYSDESKTVWVGRCTDNGCTGAYYCTGEQTEYESHSLACCNNCW